MSRLRRRRRLARLIARAHGLRSAVRREWRWARRDLRELRLELRRRKALQRRHEPELTSFAHKVAALKAEMEGRGTTRVG